MTGNTSPALDLHPTCIGLSAGHDSLLPMPASEKTLIDIRSRFILTFLWFERSLMVRRVGLVN